MKFAAMNLAAVATGGALGSGLRYMVQTVTHSMLGHDFPYGTLMVNTVGSLLIGYLALALPELDESAPYLRLLIITGVLGGFTTYSAFSIDTLQLIQDGQLSKAGLNIIFTLSTCFVAVWGGYLLGRGIHQ